MFKAIGIILGAIGAAGFGYGLWINGFRKGYKIGVEEGELIGEAQAELSTLRCGNADCPAKGKTLKFWDTADQKVV